MLPLPGIKWQGEGTGNLPAGDTALTRAVAIEKKNEPLPNHAGRKGAGGINSLIYLCPYFQIPSQNLPVVEH